MVPETFFFYMDPLPNGRMQVNKALHTGTSWCAYAAMFGSSIKFLPNGGDPGLYLRVPQIAPPMGPTSEDSAVFFGRHGVVETNNLRARLG